MANIDWESGSFSAPQTEATNWDSGTLTPPLRKRTLAALANDTVIEVANAAAGGCELHQARQRHLERHRPEHHPGGRGQPPQ